MKKEKTQFIFGKSIPLLFYIGIGLIFLFFIIDIIFSIGTGRMNFYSFFYRNIKGHIFRMFGAIFHVAGLGIGILFLIVSIFNNKERVFCFNNRFEIFQLMHKKNIILFKDISKIHVQIFYCYNDEQNLNNYSKKECRIYFENSISTFYLSYLIDGYFDDVNFKLKNESLLFEKKCYLTQNIITDVLNLIKKEKKINIPYLPG